MFINETKSAVIDKLFIQVFIDLDRKSLYDISMESFLNLSQNLDLKILLVMLIYLKFLNVILINKIINLFNNIINLFKFPSFYYQNELNLIFIEFNGKI